MAGPYDHLIGKELGSGRSSWDRDKAQLYAVGVGAGLDDPLKEQQFTTDNTPGVTQQVLPTMIAIMGTEGAWMGQLEMGGDPRYPAGIVHGDHSIRLERPIPTEGAVDWTRKVVGIYDKGSGAMVVVEWRMTLADGGEYLGASRMGLFAIGKGGFGGPRNPPDEQPWGKPDRAPDLTVSNAIGLNQSLIYRLLGDKNPHGTDMGHAKTDGFDRPVFYGLGTFGVAGRALLGALCDGDASRFRRIDGRFSKPVHPGDRLETYIWRTDEGAVFQTFANNERIVLDRGLFHSA